jgi:hypothetical protein
MSQKFGLWTVALIMGLIVGAIPSGAQEIAEGQWINLFDGESLYGWTLFGDANWRVEEGTLVADDGWSGWLATSSRFANFELSAQIRVTGEGSAGLAFRASLEGHDTENGSAAVLLKSGDRNAAPYTVSIKAIGNNVSATIDGVAVEGLSVSAPIGHIGIQYHRSHGQKRPAKIEVIEMKLRPLGLKPIFNGENLDGWNIIPDRASKFSVVDGAINIVDGNGQIETAGLYRDFILQLDIISNGEHLNSGVFFRGPVGVFWKGYESQVRNQWMRDDRTKPVDFGTGGVYGVRPARKVVSSDHEWFAKTIVCDGNRIAIWIDGYLVSDFLDTRPPVKDGDGKAGYVPEAGTIHLQGHDPTTNLSFKNINIQEYPAD